MTRHEVSAETAHQILDISSYRLGAKIRSYCPKLTSCLLGDVSLVSSSESENPSDVEAFVVVGCGAEECPVKTETVEKFAQSAVKEASKEFGYKNTLVALIQGPA